MRWEIYIAAIMLASLIIAIETVYTMADHHRTRTFGVITVFGVVAFPIAVVIHNLVSAVLGTDEAVSFIVGAVVSPAAITIGALGVAFELRAENTLASAGFGPRRSAAISITSSASRVTWRRSASRSWRSSRRRS